MFTLEKKTAVVTGGASGIGRAIVRQFLAAGATVFSVDLTDSVEDGAEAIVADVSREEALQSALATAANQTGQLDILVSNAGIQPLGLSFADVTEEILRKTFEVNVHSIFYGIKHAPTHMPKTGGRIINTSSFVGLIGVPGGSAYAVSKAAVAHATKNAAIELAHRNITVNAIAPGTVLTPCVTEIPNNPEIPFVKTRTPLGRLAQPEEIASAFQFLASEEAAYITGAVLPVDGGILAGWDDYDLPPFDPSIVH
ncbi:MAG: SDR family NAD(P)-dependent oxidoreductase [Verrucomicrobiota bacterium]